jgi:SAM-dependent methyltransferase
MQPGVDKDAYEYRGLMAQTWDALRGDPSGRGDQAFYLEVISQSGEPVLDVGCGTGRLLLDLMQRGTDVDGVDVSPEMLAICRAKGLGMGLRPALYEQAIERLDLPRRYRTILAPSSVLQLVTEPAAVAAAVSRLYGHLLPGGVLVAPFMTLWAPGMPLHVEWENASWRDEDGALLTRMGRVTYDPATQCESTEDLYQVVVEGETVAVEHHRRSPAARSYTQAQARALFEKAGFANVRVLRGFTQQAATEDDTLFTLLGTKACEGE